MQMMHYARHGFHSNGKCEVDCALRAGCSGELWEIYAGHGVHQKQTKNMYYEQSEDFSLEISVV